MDMLKAARIVITAIISIYGLAVALAVFTNINYLILPPIIVFGTMFLPMLIIACPIIIVAYYKRNHRVDIITIAVLLVCISIGTALIINA